MSNTLVNRANALATFAGTVLAAVCVIVTATDFLHRSEPAVSCQFVGTEGLQKEFGHDRAYIVFNLTADLRGEFTWNTKQLFVYLNVVFETRKNARNQMVMWSSIVEDEDKAFIELPALRPQYPYAITDQGFNLRRRPFNATVAWNVMPRVGAIATRQRSFTGFVLPGEYRAPALGKVSRAGQGVADDIESASQEWDHAEELDADA